MITTYIVRFRTGLLLAVVLACLCKAESITAYPLTDAQKSRLEKMIPRTYAKLKDHKPVHVLTLGDSVTEMFTPDKDTQHDYLLAYHAQFASLMCQEFFYPGGVRILNPAKGRKEKANEYLGNEIVIENFGLGGRASFDVIQRITTDAFLNDPDLVMIQYGINDAIMGLSIDIYKRSIQFTIDECRKRGVDVMLLGPTMIRHSPGPLEWGLEREYASLARELAEKNGVFFMDMGQVIASTTGVGEGEEDISPKDAIRVVSDKMVERFHFVTPPEEHLHPNVPAHEDMGKALFDQLLNGEPPVPFRAQGRALYRDPETIEVRLTLTNGGEETKEGYIGALTHRRILEPTKETTFQQYSIEPGESATLAFLYKRQKTQTRGNAESRLKSMDPGESQLGFSFLAVDTDGSRVLDVSPQLEPVAVTWKEGQNLGVTKGIRLDWHFVNGRDKPVQGTYEIRMGSRKASGTFELGKEESKNFFAEFPISEEENVLRFKDEVELRVKVGDRSFVFFREIEATRDLYLGERVAMAHDEYYTVGVRNLRTESPGNKAIYFRADADKNDLYFTFDLEGIELLKVPSGLSMMVEVSVDGRPRKENRQFGFVDHLKIAFTHEDGPGKVSSPKVAVFGNGYDRLIPAEGIRTRLTTRGNNARKLEIRIPRAYLYRHEWNLGDPKEVLGLNVLISMGAMGSEMGSNTDFPTDRRWTLAHSGLYYRDARSLVTLNLGKKPADGPGWSVRLY